MMNNDEKFIQECKNAFGEENVLIAEIDKQALAELAKREAKRQYQREWRRNNPDKVKSQNDRYWEKKGQALVGQLANPELKIPNNQNWCWISVLDMLPRNGQPVIFMEDFSKESPRYMNIHWGFFAINKNGWHFWEKDCEIVEKVVYWLPEPMYPVEDE